MTIKILRRAISSGAINAALSGQNVTPGNVTVSSAGWIGWSSTTVLRAPASATLRLANFAETINADLVTEATDVMAMRRGVNAQTFRLYNTYTDASNYERAGLYWSANKFIIESGQAAGTGTSRDFGILGGGTSLDVTANVINMYRNGTSNTTLFNASGTSLTSTAQNFFRLTPTINQASGTYNVLDINPTETSIGAGPHYLIRGRIAAGSDVFNVSNGGAITALYGITTERYIANGTGYFGWTGRGAITASSDGKFKLTDNAGSSFGMIQLGGSTSSFPALKRNGATVQIRLADDSNDADLTARTVTTGTYIRITAQAYAGLPTASGAGAGAMAYITDCNSTTRAATAAGGGANKVMVWSDGTNWLIF